MQGQGGETLLQLVSPLFVKPEPRIHIRHHIAAIVINNEYDCWAAATAMVMRRHSQAGVDHVKSLAHSAGVVLDQGTLTENSVQRLAHAVHLKFHALRERISLRRMEELLRRGPLVAFGQFGQDTNQVTKHAVAIHSLIGTGTSRHTKVYLVDPSPSNPVHSYSDTWENFGDDTRAVGSAAIEYILSH